MPEDEWWKENEQTTPEADITYDISKDDEIDDQLL